MADIQEAFQKFMGKSNMKKTNQKKADKNKNGNRNNFQNPKTDEEANYGYLFYKDKSYGRDLTSKKFRDFSSFFKIDGAEGFKLKTVYPGLLVGAGYPHGKLKDSKEDFQIGFYFDYTTGMPVIPGSSVKGVLRSVIEKKDFLKEVFNFEYTQQEFEDIFKNGEIVFLDAFIVDSLNEEKAIFGDDYITKHYDENDKDWIFKEPNPIKFLKILPDVVFEFQFLVKNEKYKRFLDVFKEILKEIGVGAKTNVGYGRFEDGK